MEEGSGAGGGIWGKGGPVRWPDQGPCHFSLYPGVLFRRGAKFGTWGGQTSAFSSLVLVPATVFVRVMWGSGAFTLKIKKHLSLNK